MFESILVAHDGSDGAQRAFDCAVALAKIFSSKLHMVSVEEDLPRHAELMAEITEEKDQEDRYFSKLAGQCARRASLSGIQIDTSIVVGHEVKAIVEFVREHRFDLLVVGFTGHSRIYEHIWGGTSQGLTRLAPCSVLVVK